MLLFPRCYSYLSYTLLVFQTHLFVVVIVVLKDFPRSSLLNPRGVNTRSHELNFFRTDICYTPFSQHKHIPLYPSKVQIKRYSPTTVALPRESTFLNEGFKIYFKTEIASEIVFSKASRPYLSTSALFFSPWVRQPAPPIHPPTHAIPSIKFA